MWSYNGPIWRHRTTHGHAWRHTAAHYHAQLYVVANNHKQAQNGGKRSHTVTHGHPRSHIATPGGIQQQTAQNAAIRSHTATHGPNGGTRSRMLNLGDTLSRTVTNSSERSQTVRRDGRVTHGHTRCRKLPYDPKCWNTVKHGRPHLVP